MKIWRQKEISLNESKPGTIQKKAARKIHSDTVLVKYAPLQKPVSFGKFTLEMDFPSELWL